MSGYKKYKNNTRGWDTPVYHEIYVLFFTTGYSVYLDVQSFIMELRTQTFEIQPLYYQAWVVEYAELALKQAERLKSRKRRPEVDWLDGR